MYCPYYVHVYVRGDSRGRPRHRGSEGGSESVGVCCPAFAPSLNWLPCILPKHAFVRTRVRMFWEDTRHPAERGSEYVRTATLRDVDVPMVPGTTNGTMVVHVYRTRIRTYVVHELEPYHGIYHGTMVRVPWYHNGNIILT
jgi:hypothetical protein